MALNKTKLDPNTASGSKGVKTTAIYQTTDAKATVNAANYFNDAAEELSRSGAMLIFASDATYMAKVSISAGVVTVAALDSFA